jgi:nitrogen fixation NifU-like protein
MPPVADFQNEAYREVLLRHARSPQRHGVMVDAEAKGSCRNPLCGDHVEVQLKFRPGVDTVSDVRILVSGCGIATASASLMTDFVEGKNTRELSELIVRAAQTLSSTAGEAWSDEFATLKPFESLRANPRKIPCALMAWYALKAALKNVASEEAKTPPGFAGSSTAAAESADLRAVSKNETTL